MPINKHIYTLIAPIGSKKKIRLSYRKVVVSVNVNQLSKTVKRTQRIHQASADRLCPISYREKITYAARLCVCLSFYTADVSESTKKALWFWNASRRHRLDSLSGGLINLHAEVKELIADSGLSATTTGNINVFESDPSIDLTEAGPNVLIMYVCMRRLLRIYSSKLWSLS